MDAVLTKVKFLKDKFGYKAGETHELDEGDAKGLISKGFAQEVETPKDAFSESLQAFEDRINKTIEEKLINATSKLTDKLTKGLSKNRIVVGPDNLESDPTGGFSSFGEYALDIVRLSKGIQPSEKFLRYSRIKVSNANTEATAPDAGPTVPIQYTSEIFRMSGDAPDFFSLTNQIPLTTNSVNIPVFKNYARNNSTPANGLVLQEPAQATSITPSRSTWEQLNLTLQTHAILIPVGNELYEDNIVSLDAVLGRNARFQINKQFNGGILKGAITGFSGIIGNSSAVNVATTTTAASGVGVSFNDLMAMYSIFAHDDASYENAVWFMHPTLFPKIANMTSGNYNVYTVPGGANNAPGGMLLGRPIYLTGWCNAVNTSGDIVLADLSKYVTGYKGGLVTAVSMHLYFDSNAQAFRFTIRACGKPGLSGPITLEDGTTLVSPFVTLATRV